MNKIIISGFSDEIDKCFDTQLKTATTLGMDHICLRSADGKGIAEYTLEEFKSSLMPQLDKYNVKVSSLGSPIGKVKIDDEEGFKKQLEQLHTLCQIAKEVNCKYIRVFSFYIPEGDDFTKYTSEVIRKLTQFVDIAAQYEIVLIHENEKDIYGDIKERCLEILSTINSPYFKAAFDFANFVQCGEDTKACYDLLKDFVAYIHIKDAVSSDNDNVPCGTGEGKIAEILRQAIKEDDYEGFLTLEPHLVIFDSLKDLEIKDTSEIIKEAKAKDGADGYRIQYEALTNILNNI
ncbi:sugar phosphate isomerase/epimerase family protein [Clostridium culturomicium]|uniref:sugar phosphate isomerase/epimerase family protein n=1 Tax=Clostridium culturomicium TaxID=1499683 RepID=UPI00058D23E8|nr:sugar phosphate isomerase/epimerase family protein [Clostridium culturomicium]